MITSIHTGCSDACLDDFCSARLSGECSYVLSQEGACNSSECSNAILRCQRADTTLFTITDASEKCDDGEFNIDPPMTDTDMAFGAGFYIIQFLRFCKNRCIKYIQLHAVEVSDSLNADNLLEFHIYKRYENNLLKLYVYVEQFSFNVRLKQGEDDWEAAPVNSKDGTLCVERGDYLGFSIRGDLQINSTSDQLGPVDGVRTFSEPPISQCSSTNTTLEMDQIGMISNRLPVMVIQYIGKCLQIILFYFMY